MLSRLWGGKDQTQESHAAAAAADVPPATVLAPLVEREVEGRPNMLAVGRSGVQAFAVVIENVLTEEECKQWIEDSEHSGYVNALINVGGGRQVRMDDVRNSARCIIDEEARAAELWRRVQRFVPETWGRRTRVGLNERLRFLRYDPGEYFKPHQDGCFAYPEGHPREGEVSFITLQLYLNEGFEGGETRFLDCINGASFVDVVPKTGSVLLFQHPLLHSGETVVRGRKYALRTDVMYSAPT